MDRTTFIGETEENLLAIIEAAREQLRDATAITALTVHAGGGVGRGKQWQPLVNHSPAEVIRACKFALWKLDPVKYADFKPPRKVAFARFIDV